MKARTNIAFVGGRGAGKSRTSRKFGKLSNRLTFSTDTLVCYEAGGLSVAKIVAMEGWKSFRDRETEVLTKLTKMQDIVIDCGGGILVEAPLKEGALETKSIRKMDLLKQCFVVYVKRDMNWLLDKGKIDQNRPDLPGGYKELMERRLPWYEEIADFVLDVTGKDTDDALDILLKRYGKI